MKKSIIIISIIILSSLSTVTFAQTSPRMGNYSLSEATITSGKGAISSGLDTRFDFTNSADTNMVVFMQANSDRVTVHVGRRLGNLKLIESFGVFKNMPWTGPMILYIWGPFDFMAWNGVVLSKSEKNLEIGYKPHFFISYESVGLTVAKYHKIGGSILYFGTDPLNWFVYYRETFPIGKQSKLFAEITYNHTLDIPMFIVGYAMKFK